MPLFQIILIEFTIKKKANLTPKIYLKTTGYIMTDMIKISHTYNKPRDIRIGILERAEQENKY